MKKLTYLLMAALLLTACSEDSSGESVETNVEVKQEKASEKVTASITDEPNETDESKQDSVKSDSLTEVVNHFEKQGFKAGEKTIKAPEMIGATDGFGIELDGNRIELYLYDSDSPALKEIQTSGEYNMDGFIVPAILNGNIALIGYEEHPEKDKVIEVFNNFK